MTVLLAIITDPGLIIGVPAIAVLGFGVRELIAIRERLTRIETKLQLRQKTETE